MGITGLIPFLEKASSKCNLKDLRGTTVAVDTYCWLHRGVYTCAEKLVRGEDTDLYLQYCLKYVQMLLSYDIKPILVFDGRHLPAKALTEQRRRESRQQSKKRAAELLRLGKTEEARSHMRRCVDVTHEMALKLIKECRQRNVDCIVAPYEADAQMAWLNKVDIAQYVITEDSDLTLFGARKIIFKLDLAGNGLLVEADKLYLAMGCKPEKYTFDKFRRMCIMSGCDYLDSLPGIGLAKACKFFLTTEEDNMWRALKKIPQYLKMRNLEVDDEYIESFLKAEATFRHMYIYNPLKRRMERLHDVKDYETDERFLTNAGTELEDEQQAFNLAIGNLNPFTLKQLDTWHPDGLQQALPKHIKRAKHKSMWQTNYTPRLSNDLEEGKQQTESRSAIFFKKVDFNSKSIELEIQETIQAEVAKPEEAEIFQLYASSSITETLTTTPTKQKRKRSLEDTPPTTPVAAKSRHNPFAKLSSPKSIEKSPKVCENGSLLRVLSPKKLEQKLETHRSSFKRSIFLTETKITKEEVQIKSRFFASNVQRVTQLKAQSPTTSTPADFKAAIVKIESESLLKQEQQAQLYHSPSPQRQALKHSTNDEGVPPSHTDSGIESIASDQLYQDDDDIKSELKKEEDEAENKQNPDPIMLSSDDSCHADLPHRVIKPLQQFAVKSKSSARLGLSKPKTKSKAKLTKSLSLDGAGTPTSAGAAQTRLSMFGFQKRPTLK